MKKTILSVLVLATTFAVKAQEIPERRSDKPQMMEGKMHHGGMDMKNLNLTEEQKAKFKTQNETFRKQMEELKKNDGITVKEWKAKAETLRKDHKAAIDGILTAEQKAQIEKNKADGKAKFAEMEKKRGEKMKAELGLTDEQSQKMDANRKDIGEKMKSIREDKTLSDDQKKEKMKEVMKKQKENMRSILTEEQLKKLKESNHKRQGGPDDKKPASSPTI